MQLPALLRAVSVRSDRLMGQSDALRLTYVCPGKKVQRSSVVAYRRVVILQRQRIRHVFYRQCLFLK